MLTFDQYDQRTPSRSQESLRQFQEFSEYLQQTGAYLAAQAAEVKADDPNHVKEALAHVAGIAAVTLNAAAKAVELNQQKYADLSLSTEFAGREFHRDTTDIRDHIEQLDLIKLDITKTAAEVAVLRTKMDEISPSTGTTGSFNTTSGPMAVVPILTGPAKALPAAARQSGPTA
jgi:hypothetical protein